MLGKTNGERERERERDVRESVKKCNKIRCPGNPGNTEKNHILSSLRQISLSLKLFFIFNIKLLMKNNINFDYF